MYAFLIALVVGLVGGMIGLVVGEWFRPPEIEMAFKIALFSVLGAILGAIIGGAWEIVEAIKQIRPPQNPGTDRKED